MTINLADYKAALEPYRRNRNQFICPVCQGHYLTFSPIGKWNCWNDPSRAHRLEILAAIVPDYGKTTRSQPPSDPSPEIILPPLPFISCAQLHLPLLKPLILSETIGNCTIYRYSDSQRVTRFDYRTHKVIRPEYADSNKWIKGAGAKPWLPYGLCRLAAYPGRMNIVLIVEGQKCVELAIKRGLPAICLEAGDYSYATLRHKLEVIKAQLNRPLLVILPDNDLAGLYRARNILAVAQNANIPALAIDPLKIDPQLIAGSDIEQLPNFTVSYLLHVIKEKDDYGLVKFKRRPIAAINPSSNGRNRLAR